MDKDILKKVQSIDATVDIKPLSLSDMYLSTKYKTYLSYNGSLMSPPCLETVTWFLKSHELNLRLEQVCQTKYKNFHVFLKFDFIFAKY